VDRLGRTGINRFWIYILECANGAYYVGHSSCLPTRVITHNSGDGAQFTAVRLPARLVYSEEFATEPEAVRRERQIKRWTHAKKKALIDGDLTTLPTTLCELRRASRNLSKSRD